ncbi:uncharacterized protein LOC141682721 isoform X2 [Apium graveolens]|uniref:uncharacterized protein LOC141682721 isoform X2 n=1 Tax=Apium graveolens TaxID=4045 RepID=UPI003D7A1850
MEIVHARAAEVKNGDNSTSKRRKLGSGELVNLNSENLNQCSCLINSPENSASPERNAVSVDQSPACSDEFYDNTSRSADLKVENSKTNNSTFMNRELSSSSLSQVMETTTTKTTTKNKASSAQKKPSMEEIEEFFSRAEKYEAKRFAEKYNYDIVKDVPLEGKYQWVRIKQ